MRNARFLAGLLLALAAGGARPPAALAADPPVIESITPSTGLVDGGYTVTITGSNFAAPMTATFGGTASPTVTVVSPTQATVEVPPRARGTVDVVLTRPGTPPLVSDPPGTFSYEARPSRAWVPRAMGTTTGGNPGGLDLAVVDVANRRVDASLDLNPADELLPDDQNWKVTQVLFSSDGAHAFLATAGVPGTSDSRRIFVVRSARLLGTEAGAPVIASLDTGGNPYQLALSADGKTLYAADGGSWKASSLALPNGTFRVYDVTDPAAPAALGTPTTVGILPVLTWDSTAYRRWGTHSSFTGVLQSKGGRTAVVNAGSHTVSVIDLPTRAVAGTEDAGVEDGGLVQLSVAVPSPYSDEFLLVQTTDFAIDGTGLVAGETEYFIHRTSTGDLLPKGPVSQAIRFFPVLPFPDLQNRSAWPHPDGASLVALPAAGAKVVTWSPATGSAASSAAVPGTGVPKGLAFNDVSGLFYARRDTGGWTVLSAGTARGAAPVVVAQREDATGVNSLRVVGDGKEMAGTAASSLAILDAVAASATSHQVVATVPLPLDPDGGPLFPQPAALGAPARTFVTVAGPGSGPRVVLPLAGTLFCAGEDPPVFEVSEEAESGASLELEIGSEPDFLLVPGTARIRVKVPAGEATAAPPASGWRRVLRAAAGPYANPFWARVNVVLPGGGRVNGPATVLGVCPPEEPDPTAPAEGAGATAGAPPVFSFEPGEEGASHWIELAGPGGFGAEPLGRFRAKDPAAAAPSRALWRRAVRRAAGPDGEYPATVLWRVVARDLLRREVASGERSLAVSK
ncbi:MAG: IPT/TIG domain-containing protein [Planctomycetes bacterium]|nr:IPT/TIG domain-containing protein [Planctomycetota bacterium]